MTWPTQSVQVNQIEMVNEVGPQKSIPGEAGRENAKSLQNCHQGGSLKNLKYKIYFDLLNTFLATA
jgi:hypothetical protein